MIDIRVNKADNSAKARLTKNSAARHQRTEYILNRRALRRKRQKKSGVQEQIDRAGI